MLENNLRLLSQFTLAALPKPPARKNIVNKVANACDGLLNISFVDTISLF